MQRAYRFGVGPVQLLAALAAHPNQPHVAQHAQVLGDGRLLQAERRHNVSDRPFGSGKIAQNLPPPGFSNRVERVRSGARSCHDRNITFPYRNMSRPNAKLSSNLLQLLPVTVSLGSRSITAATGCTPASKTRSGVVVEDGAAAGILTTANPAPLLRFPEKHNGILSKSCQGGLYRRLSPT